MATQQSGKNIKCGYCQAEITIPPFASVVTCDYCGTPNELQTGKTIQNHHMLSVYFSGSELTELIPQYLSKYVGVPTDFADKAIFNQFDLKMMPFWVFKFSGQTVYQGIGKYVNPSQSPAWSRTIDINSKPESGSIDIDETRLIFGYKEQFREIRDEKIPVGSKQAFDIKAVKAEGGQIFDTQIGYEEAYRIAEGQVKEHHNQLIFREVYKVERANQNIQLKEISYLHVPFYRVAYSYGNWKGEALVDAARGKVLRAEYPLSRTHRFWGIVTMLVAIGIIVGAIILLLQLPSWQYAAYTAIGIFGILILYELTQIFRKKKVAAE